MEWMILPLKRYADFQGRSRRKEYWMFALGLFILYMIFVAVIFAAIGSAALAGGNGSNALVGLFAGAGMIGILFGIFILAIIIPSIAVGVRRLHDTERTGWWIIVPTAVNLVGLVFLGTGVDIVFSLLSLVSSVALLVFMILPGTVGPNRFGPDPKDPGGDLESVFS